MKLTRKIKKGRKIKKSKSRVKRRTFHKKKTKRYTRRKRRRRKREGGLPSANKAKKLNYSRPSSRTGTRCSTPRKK